MNRLALFLTKARGVRSQTQVARSAGVSQPLVWKWEHGKCTPALNDAARVARAYDCDEQRLRDLIVESLIGRGRKRRQMRRAA